MAGVEENEDPEDRLERLQRARSNRRMRKVADVAGWVSLYALGTGFVTLFYGLALPGHSLGMVFGILVVACLAFVGPLASLVVCCLLVRLWWRGEKHLDGALVMALPGVVVSFIILFLASVPWVQML